MNNFIPPVAGLGSGFRRNDDILLIVMTQPLTGEGGAEDAWEILSVEKP